MSSRTLIQFFAALLLSVPSVKAQVEADSSVAEEDSVDGDEFVFRPTIGLGTGMLTYYGDIGKNHRFYHPTVSRVGYELRVSNPLTEYLDLGFHVLRGKLGANERFPTRNLNFESTITSGGFQLTYNFDHFLPEDRVIEPFIGVGLEGFEFLSKTDLYDENGNRYHYWSDGTIRDRPEDASDADQAQHLTRDYTYETDIRELNRDGFGKYPERSWALPLSIGGMMHLSDRVKMRLSSTMNFTFTDHIDGVTDQSKGARQGDPQNDKFLFSSVSIHYDLQVDPIEDRIPEKEEEEYPLRDLVADGDDFDGDGVYDVLDECPKTPEGVEVDSNGCPFDSDRDGIPDHRDQEVNTPEDRLRRVDSTGVALTDEDLEQRYLAYMDSTGEYTEVHDTVYSSSESEGLPLPMKKKEKRQKKRYMVQVGKTTKGLSSEERQRLLSIPDVQAIEKEDTTLYAVGDYEELPDAVRRKFELEAEGVDGEVISKQGNMIRMEQVSYVEPSRIEEEDEGSSEEGSGDVTFRVQLGAFQEELSRDVFQDVPNLLVLHGDDGLVRYLTGSFRSIEKAASHKTDMLLKGYPDAFVTAFKDGERIRLSEAGANVTGEEDLDELRGGGVNEDLVHFSIQVGAFERDIPTDKLQSFMSLGEVQTYRDEGMTKYLYGEFSSEEEAEEVVKEVKEKGVEEAFIVGVFKRNIISPSEAKSLLGEGEEEEEDGAE